MLVFTLLQERPVLLVLTSMLIAIVVTMLVNVPNAPMLTTSTQDLLAPLNPTARCPTAKLARPLMELYVLFAIITSPWEPTMPPAILLPHAPKLDRYSMVPLVGVMMPISIMELPARLAPATA
jgi:hypothetical protein